MPIISTIGRRHWKVRLLILCIYLALILGAKEVEAKTVSVRDRGGDQGSSGLVEFMERVLEEDMQRA